MPSSISLMAGPPDTRYFERPPPQPWVNAQSSVAQVPTSNPLPSFKRCTMNSIPNSPALFNKCKIPLGLLITPFRSEQVGEDPVPIVNPELIVRCRRCRTYINPWVTFLDQGQRWKCNMCFLANEGMYFFYSGKLIPLIPGASSLILRLGPGNPTTSKSALAAGTHTRRH